MRITCLAYGTRGDVQPMLALGLELKRRGHSVRLAAGQNFADWIAGAGLEAWPGALDIAAIMNGPLAREWIEHGTNPIRITRSMRRMVNEFAPAVAAEILELGASSDILISSFMVDPMALSVGEMLHKPVLRVLFQPATRRSRAGWVLPQAPLPTRESWLNLVFSRLFIQPFSWIINGPTVNAARRDLFKLPALTARSYQALVDRTPTLLAYSPLVLPPPADWPADYHTTGYLFLDQGAEWAPPAGLAAFLTAGPPPVAIGFGSMVSNDPAATVKLALAAARAAGLRSIVIGGWGGVTLEAAPDTFSVASVPHDWLFPRVAAIVHHGGAGTTAAALRAGVPQVVVPHMGDQLLWGKRMEVLGVAPGAIPRPRLSVERMAAALRATQTAPMRQRAAELGAQVRAEAGVTQTADLIERYAGC